MIFSIIKNRYVVKFNVYCWFCNFLNLYNWFTYMINWGYNSQEEAESNDKEINE